jgi:hypothetical protein
MSAERFRSDTSASFMAIRKRTGMNKKEFAAWLGVPYRIMEDWELGTTRLPEYFLKLVDYKVTNELAKGNLRESVIDNLQKKKQGIERPVIKDHANKQKEASR